MCVLHDLIGLKLPVVFSKISDAFIMILTWSNCSAALFNS